MTSRRHICITSVNFDRKPEGICTGRLVRALLDKGFRTTLITSSKARAGLNHPLLDIRSYYHGPRNPRLLFKSLAKATDYPESNFYLWCRRSESTAFPDGDVPEVFYGRAYPHASLVAAYALAQRYERPLMIHFSDPFPQPHEPAPKPAFLASLQKIVDRAAVLTFTNSETIDYQRRYLNFPSHKAAVLPHVAPELAEMPAANPRGPFIYPGSVTSYRPAHPLIEGFTLFHKKRPAAELHFFGSDKRHIRPLLRTVAPQTIRLREFDSDIHSVFSQAGTLIALDINVRPPVFTLTKIVEYLMTNRKILAITPPGSPVETLLSPFPESCVVVNNYSPLAIANGLQRAWGLVPDEEHFRTRKASMTMFRPQNVVNTFDQLVNTATGASTGFQTSEARYVSVG